MVKAEQILLRVAGAFEVKVSDLQGPVRTRHLATARQMAMWLLRKEGSRSLADIGAILHDGKRPRDHTTVLHGVRRVEGDETLATRREILGDWLKEEQRREDAMRFHCEITGDVAVETPEQAATLFLSMVRRAEGLAVVVTPYQNGALQLGESKMVTAPLSSLPSSGVVDGPTLEDAMRSDDLHDARGAVR